MKVTFKAEDHSYTHVSGQAYTPVTTVISQFKNPFDSAYWSDYKAIKDIMEIKGKWVAYKKMVGGWKNVVNYWRKNPVFVDEVLDQKNNYLQAWERKGRVARTYGSAIHKNKEDYVNQRERLKTENRYYDVKHRSLLMENPNFSMISVYTEPLIYNEFFKIAGQSDMVKQKRRLINIKDYKTNEEIKTEPFMDSYMKYPLDSLPDCDFYHYTMQLSTYAWMLEQIGYKIGDLHIEHTRTNKIIPVKYERKLVLLMLKEYAKKRVL